METPLQVFCCYAREDQSLFLELKAHLAPLERRGDITLWADTDINVGMEWKKEIHDHLNTAQIILLLVSPAFIASDYCYSEEMKRAIERHECREAHVIPIILRPVFWQETPLGKLQVLPANAKPVTSRHWYTLDEAFLNVTKGIEKMVLELNNTKTGDAAKESKRESEQETNKPARGLVEGFVAWWNSPRYGSHVQKNRLTEREAEQEINKPAEVGLRPSGCKVLEHHNFTYKLLLKSSRKEHILEQTFEPENPSALSSTPGKIVLRIDGKEEFQIDSNTFSLSNPLFVRSFVIDGYILQYSFFKEFSFSLQYRILIKIDEEILFSESFKPKRSWEESFWNKKL